MPPRTLPPPSTDPADFSLLTELHLPDTTATEAIERRAYNAAGHLSEVIDPDGVVTRFDVDELGRVLAEELAPDTADAARTTYTYDAVGRLASVTRPRHQDAGPVRRMHWDGFGRLSQVVDEAGTATHYRWDAQDHLSRVWEGAVDGADVLASVYTYTPLGHLTRHTQRMSPGGQALVTEWLDHSPEGLVGLVRTSRGQEVLTYDALGRPQTSDVSLLAGVDSAPWTPQSRTWAYNDSEGEVVRTEVSLDPQGAEVTDVTRRVFAERGWLRAEEVTREEGTLSVTFDYDANGNRERQTTSGLALGEGGENGAEHTTWSWDERNRMVSLTTPGGESRWRHTPAGRVSRIDYANGTRADFGYTAGARRLSSVVHREGPLSGSPAMAAAQYTYDVSGNRASQVLSIGDVTETTTYGYDAIDQLRHFSVLPGAGAPPSAEPRHTWYGYQRHNRVYEGRCRGGDALAEGAGPHGFGCAPPVLDDEGEVVEQGGLLTMDRELSYEGPHGQVSEVHNQLGRHAAAEGDERVLYMHDEAGNMVERRRQVGWETPPCDSPCSDGSTPDGPDALCDDGTEQDCPEDEPVWEPEIYTYDALNRLTAVARGPPRREGLGPAPSSEHERLGVYGYNADDLRIRVRESERNADAWYDGLALVTERVEQGGEWDTVRYHHDPMGLHAITAAHDGAGYGRSTHFAHRDAMGSTLAVSRPVPAAGGAGMIAASWRTDPWGLVTAETGVDHVNASIFTGHQHDFDTGLIYMRARHYDPALGQFLSADSWLGDAGHPPSLQRYLYAYGNPGVWWDPTGHWPESIRRGAAWGGRQFDRAMDARIAASESISDHASGFADSLRQDLRDRQARHRSRTTSDSAGFELLRDLGHNALNAASGVVLGATETVGFVASVDASTTRLARDAIVLTLGESVMGNERYTQAREAMGDRGDAVMGAARGVASTAVAVWDDPSLLAEAGAGALSAVGNAAHAVFIEGDAVAQAELTAVAGSVFMPAGGSRLLTRGGGRTRRVATRTPCRCLVSGTVVATAMGLSAIESVSLGDRVQTYDGGTSDWNDEEELVRVELRVPNPYVYEDVMVVELLRPRWWVEEFGLEPGTLLEFGFPRTDVISLALVLSVSSVEPPEAGVGRLVTGTFTSLRGDLVSVTLDHEPEPLELTHDHPLWSIDRDGWVPAGELEEGELLATAYGPATVASVEPIEGLRRVYTLEVDGEHEYLAGALGVRTGNVDPCPVNLGGGGTAQGARGAQTAAERRAYLNQKFGRTGDLHADINARGAAARGGRGGQGGVGTDQRRGSGIGSGNQRPIIIGENMERVRRYAESVGGQIYRPWSNSPFDYSLAMRRNERWIRDQIRQGREIVDIGPDFARRAQRGFASGFYEMERRNLAGYGNYRRVFERSGRQGGVPGLDP